MHGIIKRTLISIERTIRWVIPFREKLLRRVLRFSLRRSLPVSVNLMSRLPSSMPCLKAFGVVRIYVPISVQRNFNAAFNVARLLRNVTRKRLATVDLRKDFSSSYLSGKRWQCRPWNETCSNSGNLEHFMWHVRENFNSNFDRLQAECTWQCICVVAPTVVFKQREGVETK